jgi:hypothetical protein
VTAPVTGLTFTGSSSQGAKGSWNATVTVTNGTSGTVYGGTWSVGGTPNQCTAGTNGSCSFTRTGIAKRTGSVTWTYGADTSRVVTILKP